MNAVQILTLTMLFAAGGSAQLLRSGKCPDPAVQANFDAARYLGKWFEIQKLPTTFQKGQCATADYSLKSPGVVGVFNRELLDNGTISSAVGTAKVKDPAEPAKLEVSFSDDVPPGPYWVLSTDYDSYTLIYGCTDYGLFHMELSWILSRKPTLPKDTTEDLLSILSSIGVSVDKMAATVQDETYCSPMNQ
ncbi:apolipoprotein Da, duplicate 2 [Gambusia affinis]|uniref:apolipoprotein Da, duplicate 2 n=1 Tax=Gambusia affinis TaxID=33528 RepID=UPI001CDC2CF0|nr:apolipoprotein Da, duplicate 2 [Gambusia affinis]